MDVDLLSKMVGQLIVDNDRVGLPGVGTFVAEVVPATFSDRGYTINPPYRRLSFHQSRSEDTLLADLYAESNNVPKETAKLIVAQFLEEFSRVLKERKSITLPGLGRIRATRENNFFFVPDEDLDIYPDGFTLKPVSLKTHLEADDPVVIPLVPVRLPAEEPEAESVEEPVEEIVGNQEPQPEVEPVVNPAEEPSEPSEPAAEKPAEEPSVEPSPVPEPEPISEPEPEPQPEPLPAPEAQPEPQPEVQPEADSLPEEKSRPERKRSRWWIPVVVIIVLALIALAVFLILASVAPDFIDSILYTPEELRIINY